PAPEPAPEPAPVEPTPSTENLIDNVTILDQKNPNPTFSKVDLGEIYNDSYDILNSNFIRYQTRVYDDDDNLVSKTVHIANPYNSNVISYTVKADVTSDDANYNTTITDVEFDTNFYYGEDYLFVAVSYGDPDVLGKIDVVLYNRFGDKVAEKTGIVLQSKLNLGADIDINDDLDNYDLPLFCFDQVLYFVEEDGKLTKITTLESLGLDLSQLKYDETLGEFYINGSLYNSSRFVRYYDKTLKETKTVAYEINTNATESYTVVLNNHDVVYTEILTLPMTAAEWDGFYSGSKANITTYLISAETGAKTVIDTKYFPISKVALDDDYLELKDKSLNLAEYYEIDENGAIVQGNKLAVVGADGKVSKFFNKILDNTTVSNTQNGMAKITTIYGTYYIDAAGKPTKPVTINNQNPIYNNKWAIVNNEKVYDKEEKLIYTFDEDTSILKIFDNSILIYKREVINTTEEGIEEKATNYYLFKGPSDISLVYTTNYDVVPTTGSAKSMYYCGRNYYILTVTDRETGYISYKFYDDLGVEKAVIESSDTVSINLNSYSNGEVDYIIVKKTVETRTYIDETNYDSEYTTTHHIYSVIK
ncbi:MAG: hypothetical protein J6A54_03040, partial [Clostridia bacterium]|nr:hypothetical protein [Clostridia bacterium]